MNPITTTTSAQAAETNGPKTKGKILKNLGGSAGGAKSSKGIQEGVPTATANTNDKKNQKKDNMVSLEEKNTLRGNREELASHSNIISCFLHNLKEFANGAKVKEGWGREALLKEEEGNVRVAVYAGQGFGGGEESPSSHNHPPKPA